MGVMAMTLGTAMAMVIIEATVIIMITITDILTGATIMDTGISPDTSLIIGDK
jgi:hypothetical protein